MWGIMTNKIIYFIGFLLVYFAPIQEAMLTVGALIIIDFIFGIIAAYKTNERISSKRMGQTIIKMLVYQLLIVSSYLVGKTLVTILPMTEITLSFIGMVELFSIGESFNRITGLPFLKYIKGVFINQMKNQDLRDLLNKETDDKKKRTEV